MKLLLKTFAVQTLVQAAFGLTASEVVPIADALRELILPNGRAREDFVGGVVRLAAHDAMGSGGADGCIDLSTNGDNGGLEEFIEALQPICDEYSDVISRADCWALASIITVRATGGPAVSFEFGRVDCIDEPSNDGLLPQADPEGSVWGHVTSVFTDRMGFNAQEITALMGAHTLGRAQTVNSGFMGSWVRNPTVFDNEFYRDLLGVRWNRRQQNGLEAWLAGQRIMLPTDIALAVDPSSCNAIGGGNNQLRGCTANDEAIGFVRQYAANILVWHRDFAAAFQKLLAVGTDALEPLGHIEVGSGYCDSGFLDGSVVVDLDECAESCEENANCAFYAFCAAGEECTGDHADFCARYELMDTCILTDEVSTGYTAFKFLQGPAMMGGNGRPGRGPRPPNDRPEPLSDEEGDASMEDGPRGPGGRGPGGRGPGGRGPGDASMEDGPRGPGGRGPGGRGNNDGDNEDAADDGRPNRGPNNDGQSPDNNDAPPAGEATTPVDPSQTTNNGGRPRRPNRPTRGRFNRRGLL